MNISLKVKLLTAFILLDLLISFLTGFFMFRSSSLKFLELHKKNKMEIARIISLSINESSHKTFRSLESVYNIDFQNYLTSISKILEEEQDIRYIYTLNHLPGKGLFYGIDSVIAKSETLWIESGIINFKVFLTPNNELNIEYNRNIYNSDFIIYSPQNLQVLIKIINSPERKLITIQDKLQIELVSTNPIKIKTSSGILDKSNFTIEGSLELKKEKYKIKYTYTPIGFPSSIPGLPFENNLLAIARINKVIESNLEMIDEEPIIDEYGYHINAYSPIKNKEGKTTGVVVIETSLDTILKFHKELIKVGFIISLITFMVTVIFSIFLSTYLTRPLNELTYAASNIASGDLATLVKLNRKDEFGMLAKKFNIMVENLKIASEVQSNLITEIITLNENLEKKVEERTLTIQSQAQELKKQIQIAQKIQTALLPEKIPRLKSIEIHFKYRPMMEVGGDFLDIYYQGDNHINLFICDVSGHGVPAAFLATMVKMSIKECFDRNLSPGEALHFLHKSLRGKMSGYFLSAIYLKLNIHTGEIISANAGHLPYLVIKKNGNIDFINSKGRVIHESFPPDFTEHFLVINKGDKLLLYTDGITESRNPITKSMFGDNRLLEICKENYKATSYELCELIYSSLKEFTSNELEQFDDDITYMVTEYKNV